jgi:uncharacterized protein (DUF1499 family)
MRRALSTEITPSAARWTSRLALFSVGVVASAAFMHRVFSMPTPTAMTLAAVGYLFAVAAVALGLYAAAGIWSRGGAGTARVVVGLVLGITVIAAPLLAWLSFERLPAINDVTTDAAAPPPFVKLGPSRGMGANKPVYPGEAFARLQGAAYPDLQPLVIERSSAETFEVVAEAVRRLKMSIVREEAPAAGKPGALEAVDRTLVLGFYDDVAIRVMGDGRSARVDLRSASRYGRHDLGRNAERMRRIMREIVARLEATVPTASGERYLRGKARLERLVPRRGKAVDPKTRLLKPGETATKRGLSPSSAQRGPEQKASPPSAGERPVPGRRQGQSFE